MTTATLLAHERVTKRVARACQPGHHRAHGNPHRLSELPVREPFQLSKPEQLARPIRQAAQRPFDQCHVVGLQQQRFRIRGGFKLTVMLLVELVDRRVAAMRLPAEAGVADDSKEPRAAISTVERRKVPEGAQRGLLHHIVGVVFIANQPPGKTTASRQMGQDDIVKSIADRKGSPLVGSTLDVHVTSLECELAGHHRQRPYNASTVLVQRSYTGR